MSADISTVTLTVELTAAQAAGLKRFADKSGWTEARAVLYGHVRKDVLDEQTSSIIAALSTLSDALADVDTWPWIETGRAE